MAGPPDGGIWAEVRALLAEGTASVPLRGRATASQLSAAQAANTPPTTALAAAEAAGSKGRDGDLDFDDPQVLAAAQRVRDEITYGWM
jgi:hypothetical protein